MPGLLQQPSASQIQKVPINQLVPEMQNLKLRQFINGWLLIVGFVKRLEANGLIEDEI